MYQIFYWVHIVSYIAWLLAFVMSTIYAMKVRSEDDAVKRRKSMRSERLATSIGGHLGALGILISGGAMASVSGGPQWGWFNFEFYPWLAVKQVIFLIILVMVGISIKKSMAFKKKMKREKDVMTTETSEKWRKAYRWSLAVYILVVVNVILGLTKPF
jgi:uncharacterized membrane protein